MDTHPRYTLVGIVLVVLLAALSFWFSWLWRGDSQDKSAKYAIDFRRQSLSGLQVDSIVSMRGIKVGSVKTIAIQPQDIERVRVTVHLFASTPVRTDTRAVISRNLLTGLASIDLVGSTQAAAPLKESSQADPLPVIKEGQTGLEQVQKSVPEMMEKLGSSLDRIVLFLSDENVARVENILINVEQGSAGFSKVGSALSSAEKGFDGLSNVLAEAKGHIGPTLRELSVTMQELREALGILSSDTKLLLRSLTATSERLKEPRSSVLGLPTGRLGPGEEGRR